MTSTVPWTMGEEVCEVSPCCAITYKYDDQLGDQHVNRTDFQIIRKCANHDHIEHAETLYLTLKAKMEENALWP